MDRFATSPSQEDVSLLCKTKKKRKKVQWQWMNSPFLGEEKSQVCIFSISYLFSVHRQRRSLRKLGETKVSKNQNYLGVKIKIIKMLIVIHHFHGPLKFNFGKVNNRKFAFMSKVISPRLFLKMLKFGYGRYKKFRVQMFKLFSDIIATLMMI